MELKTVIMGCGEISSATAQELSTSPETRLVVADIDLTRAQALAAKIEAEPAQVDVRDRAALTALLADADVVVNAVGPFFRFGRAVIEAAIATSTHYIDVCDEHDITADVMADDDLNRRAQDRNLTVLVGCGATPGITNLAARWAIESLDDARTLDMFVGIPTMPTFGVTINEHMLHALSGEVPQFVNSTLQDMPALGGIVEQSLPEPFGTHRFGYMGHPEPITLARAYPQLERATIRYAWLSEETNQLWRDFGRLGLTSDREVPGTGMSPRGFIARLLDSELAAGIPGAMPTSRPAGTGWRIIATGVLDDAPAEAIVDNTMLYSQLKARGPMLTGLPAAWAALELLRGVDRTGVVSPEMVFSPGQFIDRYTERTGCSIELHINRDADSHRG